MPVALQPPKSLERGLQDSWSPLSQNWFQGVSREEVPGKLGHERGSSCPLLWAPFLRCCLLLGQGLFYTEDLGGRDSPTMDKGTNELRNCQKAPLLVAAGIVLPFPRKIFFAASVGGDSLRTSPSPQLSQRPTGTEVTTA